MLSVALNRDEHIGAVLSPPPPEQASIKGVPEKGFRLTTLQLQKEKSIAAANRAAFDAAYIAATLEWQQMVREGKCGRGDACADGVAQTKICEYTAGRLHVEAHWPQPEDNAKAISGSWVILGRQ